MAVTGAAHRDAGGKIQKAVAVHVPNLRPLAVRHDEGIVPRIGRRDDERIAREQLSRLGTRQIGFDVRLLHVQSNSPSNAFIMSSARSSSFSPITRGGARIIKLPRTANDTPRSRAVVTNRAIDGCRVGQGAKGSRVSRFLTNSAMANKPLPPRTSPITACRSCMARRRCNI